VILTLSPAPWAFNDIGANVYAVLNQASGLGLDVADDSSADRASIDQYPVISGSQFRSLCGIKSQYREPL
jgi:hypothetical protein